MADPVFRLVCRPDALASVPAAWASEMLADGVLALLPGTGGLGELSEVAHRLGVLSVQLVRAETDAEAQGRTVITFAGALALVWVGGPFSERVEQWARARGPMTLLVESDGALDDEARRLVERFVAALGRQSE